MAAWTLVVANALECGLATAYLTVGAHYARRAFEGTDSSPGLFALFWGGIGLYALLEAAWSLAVATVNPPLAVGVTILQLKVLLANAAFFGLVSYLFRLYTGRDFRLMVGAYYAVVYTLILYDYLAMAPSGQEAFSWRAGLVYAHGGTLLGTLLPVFAIIPALLAAIAFSLLARLSVDPVTRRRIRGLSAALIVFLAGLALGWLHAAWFWWPLAEKALASVAVAAAVKVVLTQPSL